MYQGWQYHGAWMDSGWMIGFHAIFWLVVLGILIALAASLFRGLGGSAHGKAAPSALEILEARYARGEIGRDEFLAKKKDLT
jgi:putative membrane protein